MQKSKPVMDMKVTVEIGGLVVYEGKSAVEVQVGLNQLPDQALHGMIGQGVAKLIPAMRVQDLPRLRATLTKRIAEEFPHSQHGRADPAFPSEPADAGCPCTGHEAQAECSFAGCGFCLAAQEMEKKLKKKLDE